MKAIVMSGCLALAVVSASRAADEDSFSAPDRSVTLEAPARANLGIAVAAATAQSVKVETRGLGQVQSLDLLGQTDAELSIAESAFRASQAAAARSQGMFKADIGVSRQVLEQAEHQAATDAAQLALAQRKAQAAWGRDAPWKDAAQRRALTARIAAGEAAIVRAVLPSALGPMADVRVERLGARGRDAEQWKAKTAWTGPADPTAPGHVYYLLIEGAGPAEGERVRVIAAAGEAQTGAYVPAAAVIIAEGATWLYIETQPNYFVRQAVDIGLPRGEGYVILHGVSPGEKVVTAGAAHLLARETGKED